MILSTKPFITGDFIEMDGGNGGTVSEIRMMTTILNTPNNQRLIIPNSQVMKSKITNYTSYPIRRMDLVISVSVTTDIEKAKEVILKKLQEDSRVLTAPAPTVMLKTINGSSLDIGVRGFTENNDYWTTTWAINEAIILAFRKQKINIPHNRVEVSLVNPNDIEQLTR